MARSLSTKRVRVVLPIKPRPERAQRIRFEGEIFDEPSQVALQHGIPLDLVRVDNVIQECGKHRFERVGLSLLVMGREVTQQAHELLAEEILDAVGRNLSPLRPHGVTVVADMVLDLGKPLQIARAAEDLIVHGTNTHLRRGFPQKRFKLAIVEHRITLPDLDAMKKTVSDESEAALLRRGAP